VSGAGAAPIEFPLAGGLVLRGARWGEGPRTLVFTHGNGLTAQAYLPALGGLFGHAQVHGLNARGHGGSDIPPAWESWYDTVADLRAYVTTALRPPVWLAGHSFGALCSLWLAAESPELVNGLILLDPLVPHRRAEPWLPADEGMGGELIARTLKRRDRWPDLAEARRSLAGKGVFAEWQEEPFERFLETGLVPAAQGGVRLACPPWLEAAIYRGRPGKLLFEWAGRVRAPAAILGGARSTVARVECLQDLADAMALATVITVAGTHTFVQEVPQAAAEALQWAAELIGRGDPATGIRL
jgi:pimeloyl-ACP methyl ester carboxylesterase